MLSLFRRPATRWPSGARAVRRGVELTRGIVICAVPDHDGIVGRVGTDLVTQAPVIRFDTGGAALYSAGRAGGAFRGVASGAGSVSAITRPEGSPGYVFSTTSITIAALRRCTDATVRDGQIFSLNTATSAQRIGISNNTGNVAFGAFGTTATSGAYTRTTELEAWVLVAGTTGMHLYCNGQVIVNTTTPLTRTASTGGMCFNDGLGAGQMDNQEIYLGLLLNREWTPTQVMEWTASPFSVLEPGPANYAALVTAAATGSGALLSGSRNRLVLA